MNDQNVKTIASAAGQAPIVQHCTELLTPGDRVTIPDEDVRVYRIVHISDRKAWVSPLLDGHQRIIRTGDLRLVNAGPVIGTLLN
ncbi:MAG: hypothetical protein ABIT04_11730 [Novosphingobium sp.]